MQVKQNTLIKACSGILLFLFLGIIIYNVKSNSNKESQKIMRMMDDYNRAVDREYRLLVSQYDDIVETIRNSDYSCSFRYEYVKKLNKLLNKDKYDIYKYSESDVVFSCEYRLSSERNDDLKLLRNVAVDKVLDSY